MIVVVDAFVKGRIPAFHSPKIIEIQAVVSIGFQSMNYYHEQHVVVAVVGKWVVVPTTTSTKLGSLSMLSLSQGVECLKTA